MQWRDRLRLGLRALLFHRRESERLRAEMQLHLDGLTAENIAAGMSPHDARHAAMRAFGNATVVGEQTQATWGWTWLERLVQDIRFAMRQIGRAPGFALIAIVTLALGIGANNAVFALTHALLLQSLPVPESDRLVRMAAVVPGPTGQDNNLDLSLPMIQAIERRSHTISNAFAWCVYDFPLTEKSGIHGIHGAVVSGNAFQALGVQPTLGRLLAPADDQPGAGPDGWAAVISHREWTEYFHGDPSVIGQHMIVTDHSVTVVGVAPEGFEGVIVAEHPDIYLPLEFTAALYGEPSLHNGDQLWLTAFARLRPVPHMVGNATETTHDCQVVGIAQDSKYDTLHEGYPPIVYLALSAGTGHIDDLFLVIHARSVADAKAAYSTALHEIAPTTPETDPFLFTQQFSNSIAREQLLSVLSGFFALLGLLLSGIGIYGLVAWNVAQRTREIGVRMALGATRLRVLALVMRQVAVLLAVGVLAGGLGHSLRRGRSGVSRLRCSQGIQRSLRHLHWGW